MANMTNTNKELRMTDLNERTLERAAATGCAVAEARLTRTRERAGERAHDHPQPWWRVMTPLEALAAGHESALVRQRYGLQRLPRGAARAAEVGRRARSSALLGEARRVPLSPRRGLLAALEQRLSGANGRRRTRTVDLDELLVDVRQAAAGAELSPITRSEEVANAYGYQATTTTTTCVRIGERVLVWIGEASAIRGSRHTPWYGGGGRHEAERICQAAVAGGAWVIGRATARKLGGAQ